MESDRQNESKQREDHLTPEQYAKKKQRLDYLVKIKRKELADYIREAEEAGDIGEGSAYRDALEEQVRTERYIKELEHLLGITEE